MSEEKQYTEAEADRFFAVKYHGMVWDLLDKPDRTKDEDERMVHTAHASLRHWLAVGTGLHQQRGEWLIGRAYAVLGFADAALRHAHRCLELTQQHQDQMADFDWAFAYEGVARANAIAGKREEAQKYIRLASEAGEAIKDQGDREVFFSEFDSGKWDDLK